MGDRNKVNDTVDKLNPDALDEVLGGVYDDPDSGGLYDVKCTKCGMIIHVSGELDKCFKCGGAVEKV